MNPRFTFAFATAIIGCLLASACASSPNPASGPATPPAPTAATKIDFAKQVQPFFQNYCYQCHANGRNSGGVRLDVRDNALRHVTPGDPAKSDVYRAITRSPGASDHMPPASQDQPDDDDIAMIKQWILEGASWPDGN
jgi:uncharacterized membrane protein